MKKLICFSFLLIISFCFSHAQKKSFSIKGNLPENVKGTVYMNVYHDNGTQTVDSSMVNNGTFFFRKSINAPSPVTLIYENEAQHSLSLFAESGDKINIEFEDQDFSKGKVQGSLINEQFEQVKKKIIEDTSGQELKNYVEGNPESIFAPYVVAKRLAPFIDYEELKSIMDTFYIYNQGGYYFTYLENKLSTLASVQIGNKAPDFSAVDTNGVEHSLHNFIEENEYTLLEFWASWCPPCRKENPNIVSAYHEYKEKGFGIFAFSLDNDINRWKHAISVDQLNWVHVSDYKGWKSDITKLYSVNSIPANVLINKEGIIVGRNLKGENLKKKLAELLN